jgi:hypothetical protein
MLFEANFNFVPLTEASVCRMQRDARQAGSVNSLQVRTKNAPSVEADIPTSAVLGLSLQRGR